MTYRHTAFLYCALLTTSLSAAGAAQTHKEWRETENKEPEQRMELRQRYTGVTPGKGNNLPRVEELKGRPGVWVTWPGFMSLANGGSRLFIQATESLQYAIHDKGLLITLSLKNAEVYLSNNRNPLVTTNFNTPLKRAYLKKHKKKINLVLELKVNTTPEISQMTDADGYHYLFVDFAPGTYPIINSGTRMPSFSGVGKSPEVPDESQESQEAPSENAPLVEESNP